MGSELGVLRWYSAITGLIALAQWQALFPARRDLPAGGLPDSAPADFCNARWSRDVFCVGCGCCA